MFLSPRRLVVALAGILLATSLTGCASGSDGDTVASQRNRALAASLSTSIGRLATGQRDAAWLAATAVDEARASLSAETPDVTRVRLLGWSGRSATGSGATIDFRISTTVAAQQATSFFGSSHGAGTSTDCVRVEVRTVDFHGQPTLTGISCGGRAVKPVPVPQPQPTMDARTRESLAAVLSKATSSSLDERVRAAFPQSYLIVDTVTWNGQLIAALSAPAEQDCVVEVKKADGSVVAGTFDYEWSKAGETGCNTRLITNPPN